MNMRSVRVRFAPAPTGMMHLGNIRTALMNYLFAQQKDGIFIVRIEDTDAERNFDPGARQILQDLAWLNLEFNEGPGKQGPNAPYFQSERSEIYQTYLNHLITNKQVYRCFCSEEQLEKKRERQIALRLPPRYDRACLNLPSSTQDSLIAAGTPFIWRFKLNHDKTVVISDLARKTVTFELKNFSDFPITRQDGSITFVFANFVDDAAMGITHVFRGEEHLSNTAVQADLYEAFNLPIPTFWHMPLLCNIEGKKLSKRDFGFSLRDLKDAGFLPEALCNYLVIIGTSSQEEIVDLPAMVRTTSFEHIHSAGHIKYDAEKLKWVNKQWIARLTPSDLAARCLPLINKAYPTSHLIPQVTLEHALQVLKIEMTTLNDCIPLLAFLYEPQALSKSDLELSLNKAYLSKISTIVSSCSHLLTSPLEFAQAIKTSAKHHEVPLKEVYWFIRLCFMKSTNGPSIQELVEILGEEESKKRLIHGLNVLRMIE